MTWPAESMARAKVDRRAHRQDAERHDSMLTRPADAAERERLAAELGALPDPPPRWRPGDLARSVWSRELPDGSGAGWRTEPVDPETGAPILGPRAYWDAAAWVWIDPDAEPDLAAALARFESPAAPASPSLDTRATTRHWAANPRSRGRLRAADKLKRQLIPVIERAAAIEYAKVDGAGELAAVAGAERAHWLGKRALALADCRHVRAYREATCGVYLARPASCRVRVCPDCERARAGRLARRLDGLTLDMARPVFWTFTVPNVPHGELARGVDWLLDAFRALRRRALFRGGPCPCGLTHAPVAGGVYSLEVTPGKANRATWHPHAHVLMDSPWLLWSEVRDAWRAVTCDAIRKLERPPTAGRRPKLARCLHLADDRGIAAHGCRGASIVWVSAIAGEPGSDERRAALRETLKYATGGLVKDGKLAAGVDGESLGELLLALRNRRLVAGWAGWRHVHDDDADDELPAEMSIDVDTGQLDRFDQPILERMPARCPNCGAAALWESPISVPRGACEPVGSVLLWHAPRSGPLQ